MEEKGKQQQPQGCWRRAMTMIRSLLAFQSPKQRDDNSVPITKRSVNPGNGPVPILPVDVDKETEKFITRVRSNLKNSVVGEDQPTINGSNGPSVSPG